MLIRTEKSPCAKASPLPYDAVHWTSGFWKNGEDICATATVPHVLRLFESDEGFHAVANFKIAAGLMEGSYQGPPFTDGDFYKILEGAMFAAALLKDASLESRIDDHIELISKAIQPDGYLSTKQIIGERQNTGVRRQGDVNDFEAYNFGHLFTAACTHHRLTGKRTFLDIAIKAAGYMEKLYLEAERTGQVQTAVCPSHYMGLIELYRETGDQRFLDTAARAIFLRDRVPNGTDDNQDRTPLLQHETIVGHAVRANYLYAGVTDLYLETGDSRLIKMLHRVWHNLVDKKLYITGGCGALYSGVSPFGDFIRGYMQKQVVHQAYGYEYQLPNVTAYNETCASLGHIFWLHRLFAAEPQARLFDLIERSYLNLVLAAVSLDGEKYFYENMLRRTKKLDYELMWPLERTDNLSCFCCPTNLSRGILQAKDYVAMVSDDTVWLGMYGAHEARCQLQNGANFTWVQETDYPWDGRIHISFKDITVNRPLFIQVRIPGWVESGFIDHNGQHVNLTEADADTYRPVRIENLAKETISIQFDMPARYTVAHAMAEETVGQVAVERGPLVYCIETKDAPIETIDDLYLLSDATYVPVSTEINGRAIMALESEGAVLNRPAFDRDRLYQTLKVDGLKTIPIRLIPYFAWDNRGFGEMRIWLPILYRF